MHPDLTAQLARTHIADLRREALTNCCTMAIRLSLRERVTTATRRLIATLAPRAGTVGTASPACCPA